MQHNTRRISWEYGTSTVWHSVARGVLAALVLLVVTTIWPHAARAASCSLTSGHWVIFGSDAGSGGCDGSTLQLTFAEAYGDDVRLEGHFDWTCSNAFGREVVVGTLFANDHLVLTGVAHVPPISNIVLAHYEADLTEDCRAMTRGTWVPVGGGLHGSWHAEHVAGTLGGTITGGRLRRVVCRNKTTNERVVIKDGSPSWDCEVHGLLVHPGDDFQIVLKGTVE
jgi:hypothetical protein